MKIFEIIQNLDEIDPFYHDPTGGNERSEEDLKIRYDTFMKSLFDGVFMKIGNYTVLSSKVSTELRTKRLSMFVIHEKNKEVVGQITFNPENGVHGIFWRVVWSFVKKGHRGNKIMEHIYKKVLDLGFILLSDYEQAKGSEIIWRRLYPKYHVYLAPTDIVNNWASSDHKLIKIKNAGDYDKAYKDKEYRLVASKRELNTDKDNLSLVEEKLKLSDDVIEAFTKLGHLQRGAPEDAMLKVQFAMGGGVLNPVVEHVGDLTHRMSHMAKYGNMGHEFVSEKVNKTLGWLTNEYGFEREFKENVQNNAKYNKTPVEEYSAKIDKALERYANEHKKLPVYNRVQWLAREAAIAVGEKRFNFAVDILRALKKYTDDVEKFNVAASQVNRDSSGKIVQYKK